MTAKNKLEEYVRLCVQEYFDHLQDVEPSDVHDMLIRAVERPLLEVVMERADHNQSKAAQWLGLNRNTLRKKLLEQNLIS